MGNYSHSKLSSFEQCPLKYRYRYIDKIKPEFENTIETHLGKCVHDTLEWIYNSVMTLKKPPSADEVLNYYINKWKKSFNPNVKIVKFGFNQEDYFNKGVQFLMNYYSRHQPFKDGTLECEKKILVNLGEHKIQGFIDRLVYNKEKNEYEIHDYKTANSLPTKEKVEADRQLALYSIAIKSLFGDDKNVCLTWHYLAHDTKICSYRTNKQLEELKKEILEIIKKIESTKIFSHSQSVLCGWCEYKYACPGFGNKPPEKQNTLDKYERNDELDIWD